MPVGERRHETIRQPLSDVARRQHDAFRIVVAEPHDRLRKLPWEVQVDAQGRQRDVARHLHDGPVARVDFHVRIARIDQPRPHTLAADDKFDPIDRPRLLSSGIGTQRHNSVLDGDEIAIAQIAGRAVVAVPEVVLRVELDEALAARAQQADGHQPHLVLELRLQLIDQPAPLCRIVVGSARRPGDTAPVTCEARHLGTQRFDARVLLLRTTQVDEAAERKRQRGNDADQQHGGLRPCTHTLRLTFERSRGGARATIFSFRVVIRG